MIGGGARSRQLLEQLAKVPVRLAAVGLGALSCDCRAVEPTMGLSVGAPFGGARSSAPLRGTSGLPDGVSASSSSRSGSQPGSSAQHSLTAMLTATRASAPAASSGRGGASCQAGSARREKPSSPAVQGSTQTKGASRGA